MRFPIEIVEAVREKVGENFIIIFRLSMLDLIEQGSSWDEVVLLAKALEEHKVNIINTGIGWHEARIPTIAQAVPRGGFAWVTERLKPYVNTPLVATNRINTPAIAEEILVAAQADLISMARPFLADPEFANKAKSEKPEEINICIACNQSCLDHVFQKKSATCLVNPIACRETKLIFKTAIASKTIAVIGAGPGGLAFSAFAAEKGHHVTLFDKSSDVGGQFNLAKRIPGKGEFAESIQYFKQRLVKSNVEFKLNQAVTSADLLQASYDIVVLATGVKPRIPNIKGIEHPKVITYIEAITQSKPLGNKIAIIGAGGIGFDVAEYLLDLDEPHMAVNHPFYKEWGIDIHYQNRGGLLKPEKEQPNKQIFLCQRKKTKLGKDLGKTTGWIHRAHLKRNKVKMLSGVKYDYINDEGLWITQQTKQRCLDVDNIILCAGQQSIRDLYQPLVDHQIETYLIGGADVAVELDAARAIKQGAELAAKL